MKVKICGISHKIIQKKTIDEDCEGIVQGKILHSKQKIFIKKDLPKQTKEETLCHEIVHGILLHIGYTDLSSDEQFVQSLSNAIYQSFKVKEQK